MKNLHFLLITFILMVSCEGFKAAGKVLRNEKVNSTDEFLVKKREPLILPPDYDVIPEPNSQKKNDIQEKEKIKKILKKSEGSTSSKSSESSTSTENSILRNIRK